MKLAAALIALISVAGSVRSLAVPIKELVGDVRPQGLLNEADLNLSLKEITKKLESGDSQVAKSNAMAEKAAYPDDEPVVMLEKRPQKQNRVPRKKQRGKKNMIEEKMKSGRVADPAEKPSKVKGNGSGDGIERLKKTPKKKQGDPEARLTPEQREKEQYWRLMNSKAEKPEDTIEHDADPLLQAQVIIKGKPESETISKNDVLYDVLGSDQDPSPLAKSKPFLDVSAEAPARQNDQDMPSDSIEEASVIKITDEGKVETGKMASQRMAEDKPDPADAVDRVTFEVAAGVLSEPLADKSAVVEGGLEGPTRLEDDLSPDLESSKNAPISQEIEYYSVSDASGLTDDNHTYENTQPETWTRKDEPLGAAAEASDRTDHLAISAEEFDASRDREFVGLLNAPGGIHDEEYRDFNERFMIEVYA
ncbi:uncharacterized protein BJ171DRAFT_494186 [Polychytrium aggregatum]|uniref:uncharacterized protein n=1 Tax=Polychytrium aggregatum TaxID=110093 RepID=UPI0022FEA4AF|nr:uncharacterized protein BJ171DRAFT_494186 [Polychytrium aggregatum]KAI9207297.1 hypothetical protein BJ171DRAFT_494186 [Polychytrium aggregatum]